MVSAADLDDLMHGAWPGLTNVQVDGWVARFASGVTQRANSVLPRQAPPDITNAVETVEALYRARNLTPTFQISPAAEPPELDTILSGRGYERRSPTLVQVAGINTILGAVPPHAMTVNLDDEPHEEWMELWWAVDGRGGAKEKAIARHILQQRSALYASMADGSGVAAVGRLAAAGAWGGIYCMAVREDVRRRGLGRAILCTLVEAARDRCMTDVWLQVEERNRAAREMYRRVGFITASRYHYRARV